MEELFGIIDDGIPTCFKKYNYKPGQIFHARITEIFDPSKFWLVTKYRELEVFQKCLFRWYHVKRSKLTIPRDEIKMGLSCVTFCNGAYYRGVVVGFPINSQKEQAVQLYLFDCGSLTIVEWKNVYYMRDEFLGVPKFAIRASLAGICPKKSSRWTSEDASEFHKLATNKVLTGEVVNVDSKRELLEVHVGEAKNGVVTLPIHKILITQGRARYFHDKPTEVEAQEPGYPYLFPSHEAIESGKVPSKLCDLEYQVQLSNTAKGSNG